MKGLPPMKPPGGGPTGVFGTYLSPKEQQRAAAAAAAAKGPNSNDSGVTSGGGGGGRPRTHQPLFDEDTDELSEGN